MQQGGSDRGRRQVCPGGRTCASAPLDAYAAAEAALHGRCHCRRALEERDGCFCCFGGCCRGSRSIFADAPAARSACQGLLLQLCSAVLIALDFVLRARVCVRVVLMSPQDSNGPTR